jgi:acyl-[acyl carrier protein]--UDP-N-acetylglucosamine O-acyltransferase
MLAQSYATVILQASTRIGQDSIIMVYYIIIAVDCKSCHVCIFSSVVLHDALHFTTHGVT